MNAIDEGREFQMVAEKKTAKKAVKKVVVKKPAAPKAAVKKTAEKKAPAKKNQTKRAVARKEMVSQERFYAMVSEAAYFSAQNDGNKKSAAEYWLEAEAAVRTKFDVA